MKHFDANLHARGESLYCDDIPISSDTLHAAVLPSPIAHGKIKSLDLSKVKKRPGVVAVLTHADIPGENQVGVIIQDEPLLAEDEVHYIGQAIALVLAESPSQARLALLHAKVEFEPLPAIIDPREAFAKNSLIAPPRTFSLGDTEKAWDKCDEIVEGRIDSGAQEHFYFETQSAIAIPVEPKRMKIISSTQSPSGVQKIVARILGLPMNAVEVDVRRLGGAFGGKEDQATTWACLVALAAYKLGRSVKIVLKRREDMMMTGKRHPYSSDFKIGLTKKGEILAYEVMFHQNSGAAADLSTSILERTLFHCTNSYFIPNVKATAACCKTNILPNTAFRGFGAPQAVIAIEAAIHKAANKLGLDSSHIQKINLLKDGDTFPYGAKANNCRLHSSWRKAEDRLDIDSKKRDIEKFNALNKRYKKALATIPVCFGISFTNSILNQAGALVHIYTDGSVSVSTGAIEMGQGVNTKIVQVAAKSLSIDPKRVTVESTNTKRVANTSPTAASTGADLNCKATEIACQQLVDRLKIVAATNLNLPNSENVEIRKEIVYFDGKKSALKWEKLIQEAYVTRNNLSAQAFYATPGIYFDKLKEKGEPFAYHVFGVATVTVTLDGLLGTYEFDEVNMIHDAGKSLNPLIDKGQAEGAMLQGLGWVTIEELRYSDEGKLLSNNASAYKLPHIKYTPKNVNVYFLENADNPKAVLQSKAIGEPPFIYGLGAYFAILKAIEEFRPNLEIPFDAPLTPEKVLIFLQENDSSKNKTCI